jgi:beta-lactamase regulating signal transducer with metallopeptidase domain
MRTDLLVLTTVAYLLKATGVLLITIAAAALLRRAPAGTKHTVWLGALVLLLALPLLAGTLPEWRVLPLQPDLLGAATAPWRAPAAAPGTGGAVGLVGFVRDETLHGPATPAATTASEEAAPPLEQVAPASAAAGSLPLPVSPAVGLMAIWGLGMLLVLSRLAGSALLLRRTLREAHPLSSSDWTTPLWEAADRLDLENAPRLLRSERVTMPFACGLTCPTIVLPAASDEWSPSRRRAVLFHELAHIRRRDLVGHTLGRLACAIYWMHPLVWTAARRLRAESERACDDLVLSSGTPASEYADHLLQILVGVRWNDAPAVALPMGRRREFEGRMLAILDPALRRHGPTLAHGGVMSGLALAALLLMAAAPASWSPAGDTEDSHPGAVVMVAHEGKNVVLRHDDAVIATVAAPEAPLPDQPPAPPVLPAPKAADAAGPDARPRPDPRGMVELAEEFGMLFGRSVEDFVTGTVAFVFGAGGELQKNIPLLIRLLATDESPDVRRTAAWGLAKPDRPEAIEALAGALAKDSDADVREMAAWALRGVATPDAVAVLIGALRDGSSDVRARAAWALGHSGIADERVLGGLTQSLNDESAEVRQLSAWALGTLHPAKAPPALYGTGLAHEEAEVRVTAAWALGAIADPAARPALAAALDREANAEALRAITWALLALGPIDGAMVEKLLASGDPEVRARAVRIAAGAHDPWPWPWPWPEVRVWP